MRNIGTAELRDLEVINLCGGNRLGYVCELEIDADDGRVLSLLVSEGGVQSLFSKNAEYCIPWHEIECIGRDAILVRIPADRLHRTDSCKWQKCDKSGKHNCK